MNLHLLEDEKFSEGAIIQFEDYYPNQNIYIVNTIANSKKFVSSDFSDNIIYVDIFSKKGIDLILEIANKNKIVNVFIHYLTPAKALITELLKQIRGVKSYWIFYGGDLYWSLYYDYNYDLFDKDSIIKVNRSSIRPIIKKILYDFWSLFFFKKRLSSSLNRFLKNTDYFCFWNYYDYKLLKDYYNTKAIFKDFIYINAIVKKELHNSSNKKYIMVNNSASVFGNHITILAKINKIDIKKELDIFIPLNYGEKDVIEGVIDFTNEDKFKNQSFLILKEYLNIYEYNEILNDVKVAIFGSKRQEAAGNIFMLLAQGTKVFLREGNNLLNFFKENNFVIFSFEKDLNKIEDFDELDDSIKMINKQAFEKYFDDKRIDKLMKDLLQ
ncbi:hypothetical protein BAX94_02200 [Elizabethkingia meningoseptica]|uniref:4-alpha-L-fucosyltransferase glycosyl transferase group 56 n=1 Tax=Elizabethkingia meningoseptica TaxID=238 RepID=A0A1T3IYN2_ELIME|nr:MULTISPECIES: TDP-N-acetylfucosamine:lipid II N-acetylfucosaminyltransferase [Elizabethkingia]AQX12435.1 hypothetical protein BBD35_08660 [Elizabethkingia meningoseptica]MBG0513973.1 TDP-N-acetylfucosamine:lipid II N-acetylfucosaminyltransferase [Elizabethkingia meningoseptica]MDE5432888.1 TDP-N-acetylfucosamine:lipid II N-acetylfucosaminyltransferase [Elizabethkingia meningoseptica]MDE5448028.1 TDP-N-acetylfucosamine:lipid II N-acetylfucosaminyltransferase [Elizabethkingia meningoseptica]M